MGFREEYLDATVSRSKSSYTLERKHVFSEKATGTSHSRAGPIWRFVSWCKMEQKKPFPVCENMVYLFMKSQATTCAPTFLRSFVVDLVVGFPNLTN